MEKIVLILSLTISTLSLAGVKVIYGEDNRSDIYDTKDSSLVELAKSTAAMIHSSNIRHTDLFTAAIESPSLRERGVCESERFSNQPAAANCSGFLIGEKLIATAGHCIQSQADCDNFRWVFDYKVDYEGQSSLDVEVENIYRCKQIISQSLDSRTQNDYAVIELERSVNRRVLNLRTSGQPSVGDEVFVIGHPSGLPTKVTTKAHVRDTNDIYFKTNLDTYGGNSGSAVFNATTQVVEGILVRGAQDYKWNAQENCKVSNVIDENKGQGEDVTHIKMVLEYAQPESALNESIDMPVVETSNTQEPRRSRFSRWLSRLLKL